MRNYRFFKNNNNTKIASRSERVPFKWAGAKNRMFNKYISRGFFLKKEPKLFVDMFAGTGTVGKWVAENYPNTTVVLNETCDELIHMYKQLKAKNYSNFEKEYLKHAKAYAAYSSVEDSTTTTLETSTHWRIITCRHLKKLQLCSICFRPVLMEYGKHQIISTIVMLHQLDL